LSFFDIPDILSVTGPDQPILNPSIRFFDIPDILSVTGPDQPILNPSIRFSIFPLACGERA